MLVEVNVADIRVERTTPTSVEVIADLAKNIQKRGLQSPILTDPTLLLIDGLNRLRALELLGTKRTTVEMASTLPDALKVIRDRVPDPRNLSLRRLRDFIESIDYLYNEQIQENFRRTNREGPVPMGSRELVAATLGHGWNRQRRVMRWVEEDPNDPERQKILLGLEEGTISINAMYKALGGHELRSKGPLKISPSRLVGDITTGREQEHLLEEVVRQFSGLVKSSAKLGYPIRIESERLKELVGELTKQRAKISRLISNLRKEL